MSETRLGIDKIQQLITRGPFNRWLDFTIVKSDADGLEVRAVPHDAHRSASLPASALRRVAAAGLSNCLTRIPSTGARVATAPMPKPPR